MKDAIIFASVIVIIVVIPIRIGGFAVAFTAAKTLATGTNTLAGLYLNGFISLTIMSALALYLYPHAINGVLSTNSTKRLRMSTALLPIYGIGLALLALFGILIYAVPSALADVTKYGAVTVVPSLIYAEFPAWFVGFAFLGIFIGGLVPASIMAISQANLLTRNVIKVARPNMTSKTEARLAKWFSVMFKFIALAFIFAISATYSLELQLVGGIIILQTLPAIFIGMYTNKLNKYAVGVGWLAGMISGVFLILDANFFIAHLPSLQTTFFKFTTPFSFIYIGLIALLFNLLIAIVGSLILGPSKKPTANSSAA
ncbi:Na+/solute symporter [mine drainage metagenome]|uniref:Na+/solute symporter n=1 Tax=mine drainage metagenome TaxID=410659 RepID=T1CDH9_9ZZZZ